jgi:hypothetical protein
MKIQKILDFGVFITLFLERNAEAAKFLREPQRDLFIIEYV